MNALFRFCLPALACLVACSEPGGDGPSQSQAGPGESVAEDAAVAEGRAELFEFERQVIRRTAEGTLSVHHSVALPQFRGDAAGLERINGFLRHLAFEWPDLPRTGRTAPPEAEAMMREVGKLAATLRPEEWPTLAELGAFETVSSDEIFGREVYLSQSEASFRIRIVSLDSEKVVLHLGVFDASGATTRGNEGELTLDLHSGEAIHPR